MAVASTLGIDVGWFILYSLIVAIPASLCGGWIWGEFLGKKYSYSEEELKLENAKDESDSRMLPSAGLSFLLIFLPIFIIVFGTVLNVATTNETLKSFASFLTGGSGVMALLITDFIAMICLRKYFDLPLGKLITKTFNESGEMLFILGAGGSFGAIVTASGIGDVLVNLLSNMNISVIVLAYILCLLLRAALGSATTALLTTSTILGPVASQMGANMVLLGLAICVAAVGLGLPTDGAFWMISGIDNLEFNKTTASYTFGSTVASAVGFALVIILSVCSGLLPGLH